MNKLEGHDKNFRYPVLCDGLDRACQAHKDLRATRPSHEAGFLFTWRNNG